MNHSVYIIALTWYGLVVMDASEKYKTVFCDELFDKPERLIVVGASNVGKSYFINKLIKKYAHKFTDIIISGTFKSELQQCSDIKKKVKIHADGIYNPFLDFDVIDDENIDQRHILLFYDDCMSTFMDSKIGADIFFKGRHFNFSVIVTLQNYFYRGKEAQTIRAQTTQLILFKIRNIQQVSTLSRSLESGKDRIQRFHDIYNKYVTNKKYGYIGIFLDCDDLTRYRTDLVDEKGTYDTVIKFV